MVNGNKVKPPKHNVGDILMSASDVDVIGQIVEVKQERGKTVYIVQYNDDDEKHEYNSIDIDVRKLKLEMKTYE